MYRSNDIHLQLEQGVLCLVSLMGFLVCSTIEMLHIGVIG